MHKNGKIFWFFKFKKYFHDKEPIYFNFKDIELYFFLIQSVGIQTYFNTLSEFSINERDVSRS